MWCWDFHESPGVQPMEINIVLSYNTYLCERSYNLALLGHFLRIRVIGCTGGWKWLQKGKIPLQDFFYLK
jgi:hypothetical protein